MAPDELTHRLRPAAGDPEGALVLMHGRGVDEHDLFPLLDLLDPERRLVGVTPRAPLTPPRHTGNHWYVVERVGYPDAATFARSYEVLAHWVDGLAAAHALSSERVVVGGFSQGTVMAFAVGLGRGRPRPGGILGMSGFVPAVAGWEADPDLAHGLRVYLSHGVNDPVIPVEFAREARRYLHGAGAALTYRETPAAHHIDPRTLEDARDWLAETVR